MATISRHNKNKGKQLQQQKKIPNYRSQEEQDTIGLS
jgi:hypothetical protein